MHRNGIYLTIFFIFSGIILFTSPTANALEDGRFGLFDVRISPSGEMVAFSWAGDIWIADIDSGECTRVTDHVAYDHDPAWFPSSDRLAFSSNRDGNDDVYSVPISGGEPERHTWHGANDIVQDVHPDGSRILFVSTRGLFSFDLYEVDTEGGLERALTHDTSRNFFARYYPNGAMIIVSRGIYHWTRSHYNGSGDTDLYSMDTDGQSMTWVENSYDGNDNWPCVYGDNIYFTSDRELGCANVWVKPWSGVDPIRLTDFTKRPVMFLSVSNTGKLCFVQDFRINILNFNEMTGEYEGPWTVDLDLGSEPKHSQEIRLDINGNVTEMESSPLGTNLAVIARGDLFMIPLHDPNEPAPLGDDRYWEAVRVTETPSREQYVTWHPDGDRVTLSSDKNGNFELYEIDLRAFEWTRLTETPKDEVKPKYSPDGSMLAFYYGNDQLTILDLESMERKVIAEDLFVFQPWIGPYEWSSDGKWIAYTGSNRVYYGEVFIVPSDGSSDPVNLTLHHDNDTFGGWTPDGNKIFFLSRRDFVSGLEGYGWWWSGGKLYTIDLQHSPQPASDFIVLPVEEVEEDVDEDSESENDDVEESEDEEKIEIDFDRIDERVRQIAHMEGGSDHAAISPDGSTYVFEANVLGNWALWEVSSDGGSPTQITTVSNRPDDIEWLPDGSGVLYLVNRRVYYWEKSSGMTVQVPTYGRMTINLNEERREMVYEAGRLLGSHFYDEEMHGYDWEEIVDLYAPLVEEAAVGEEFTLLLNLMFGELDASHLGAWTASSSEGIGANIAEIGLEFDRNMWVPGLLVDYVLPRGPADYDESRIEVGEWVLAINGTEVSPEINYWSLLDDAVGRSTVLTVASDQNGSDLREVTIIPVPRGGDSGIYPGWSSAAYEAWVEENRAQVEGLSDGRVGYVHIRWMGGSRLERFARELFAENYDKEAVIIDIRWNPGGNIHEYLLEILSRPQFGWSRPRDGEMVQQPGHRWGKPTVLLINERSSSDSEIFPAGFRSLGLGTIIGERTLGAVIGTEGYTLIDGQSGIRLPMEGWFSLDGSNLENDGVEPDIRVVNDLNHIRDGIDDQLIYAVEYLLDGFGE